MKKGNMKRRKILSATAREEHRKRATGNGIASIPRNDPFRVPQLFYRVKTLE